jgi:uncharacterized membrane protein
MTEEELKQHRRDEAARHERFGYILLFALVIFICWNEERKTENAHRRTMERSSQK